MKGWLFVQQLRNAPGRLSKRFFFFFSDKPRQVWLPSLGQCFYISRQISVAVLALFTLAN